MKKLRYILFLSGFILESCQPSLNTSHAEAPKNDSTIAHKGATISFNEELHDFGTVIQGEKVFYSFRFKNTGDEDLVISTAQGSCGCTVPAFSKGAIKPEGESAIDVVFDSENLMGIVEKTITVICNSTPSGLIKLKIKSNIVLPNGKNNTEL